MKQPLTRIALVRKDDRVILHFDYSAFYAAVIENERPALRALPLAIQQKNIIVTCNYEARRRGLRKLQLVSEAKKLCPEVVLVVGEQLDRFRDASKVLCKYLESFTWNKKVEKLGFDEVFLDITDVVAHNRALLNSNDLSHSFFQLSLHDPTIGFSFDATKVAGHEYPERTANSPSPCFDDHGLLLQLMLGSHLAQHIRYKLEEEKGYVASVGISTSKLLAKLVGALHKPKGQTTLMPPYVGAFAVDTNTKLLREPIAVTGNTHDSNVTRFIDSYDIGKIPGIGFKMSHKIRNHVLSREAQYDEGLIYGGTKECVTVRDVRLYPGMGPQLLEMILGGSGTERSIGGKTWNLINGIDDSEVKGLRKIPSQISIEDSYIYLDTLSQVRKELRMLATSLLRRMHIDLLEGDEDFQNSDGSRGLGSGKRWVAHPKTIRLSTRPRAPLNSDGSRTRTFNRTSRSGPMPNFVFDLREGADTLTQRLVQETLIPMFHHLHPEKHGWNLSLINIGVTNMVEAASEDGGGGGGRDIGHMFRHQTDVLREWKVEDRDVPPDHVSDGATRPDTRKEDIKDPPLEARELNAGDKALEGGSEDAQYLTQNTVDEDMLWNADEYVSVDSNRCTTCDAVMPAFAMVAHERFHFLGDG